MIFYYQNLYIMKAYQMNVGVNLGIYPLILVSV